MRAAGAAASAPPVRWVYAGLKTVAAYLWLMRVHASIASVTAVLVTAVLLDQPWLSAPVLLAALAIALIAGAGNSLNDCYDYEIDRINKPGRAIPSGAVSMQGARRFSWLLLAGGTITALFLNLLAAAIAAGNVILLIAYARRSKQWGLAKNAVVSYLVASVFLFTAAAIQKFSLLLLALTLCSFLATLSREIMKDVEDVEGDLASGSKTLPIRIGLKQSHTAAFAMLAISLPIAAAPYAIGLMSVPGFVLICAGGLIFACAFALKSASTSQKYIMVGSMIWLCAFLAARL